MGWIHCTIERAKEFEVTMADGTAIVFRRYLPHGKQLAQVDDPAHEARLLEITEGYRAWDGPAPEERNTVAGAADPAAVAAALALTAAAQNAPVAPAKPADEAADGTTLNPATLSGAALREFAKQYLGPNIPPRLSDEKIRDRVIQAQIELKTLQIEDAAEVADPAQG